MKARNIETIVRWGILSTAHINRRLIPEMHASARCSLKAVASRDLQKAREYADKWQIPVAYGTYEELIEDPELDVIYISVPNDLHAMWTIKALEAGKHVLCEKPLCLSLNAWQEISDAGRENNRTVLEAFMYVHHPQTAFFRSLIDSGAVGDLVAMRSEFAATINRAPDNYRWSASQGGGALWDIGVYPVSFFQRMHDAGVKSVCGKAAMQNGIDMSFMGTVDFVSGVSGQFFASFESVYSTRTSIIGKTGRIDITNPFNAIDECSATLTTAVGIRQLDLPRGPLYAGEIEALNDVVIENRPPVFSLEDSRRILETILALRADAGMVHIS